MDIDTLTTIATDTNGQLVTVTMTDGGEMTVVSQGRVTTKGFVYKLSDEDTKVGYIPRTRIQAVSPVVPVEEMTTATLAERFGTDPKSLRVQLRALGLGVGKGRRYAFTPADLDRIKAHMESLPVE